MRLPLVVVVVAAAASALDLGQGWRVSLDGDTITARRRGVPGLEALAVTFSVGYLSGGGPTTLPNPIGFTAAKFTADLDAPLGNLTLRATAAGAEASGASRDPRAQRHGRRRRARRRGRRARARVITYPAGAASTISRRRDMLVTPKRLVKLKLQGNLKMLASGKAMLPAPA